MGVTRCPDESSVGSRPGEYRSVVKKPIVRTRCYGRTCRPRDGVPGRGSTRGIHGGVYIGVPRELHPASDVTKGHMNKLETFESVTAVCTMITPTTPYTRTSRSPRTRATSSGHTDRSTAEAASTIGPPRATSTAPANPTSRGPSRRSISMIHWPGNHYSTRCVAGGSVWPLDHSNHRSRTTPIR